MRFSIRPHRARLRAVSQATAPSPRRRDGFTMPELMIAIIVICVGLLSLATGSMGVLRQMRWGNQSALAAIVATARMENMRSKGCNAIASGTTTTRGLPEKWVITPITSRASAVVESVTYVPRPGLTRYVEMKSVVPCT
jgi:prepilin-type N-terminal cleavage/methylation domain-containing protein